MYPAADLRIIQDQNQISSFPGADKDKPEKKSEETGGPIADDIRDKYIQCFKRKYIYIKKTWQCQRTSVKFCKSKLQLFSNNRV